MTTNFIDQAQKVEVKFAFLIFAGSYFTGSVKAREKREWKSGFKSLPHTIIIQFRAKITGFKSLPHTIIIQFRAKIMIVILCLSFLNCG